MQKEQRESRKQVTESKSKQAVIEEILKKKEAIVARGVELGVEIFNTGRYSTVSPEFDEKMYEEHWKELDFEVVCDGE